MKSALLPMLVLSLGLVSGASCARDPAAKNALAQNTGEAGSTIPKAHPPYYPNTAGNIVAPPGNPGGNHAGSPPIVGGTQNQQGGWPEGR